MKCRSLDTPTSELLISRFKVFIFSSDILLGRFASLRIETAVANSSLLKFNIFNQVEIENLNLLFDISKNQLKLRKFVINCY